jgi:polyisoprenoid-binding protein YceI
VQVFKKLKFRGNGPDDVQGILTKRWKNKQHSFLNHLLDVSKNPNLINQNFNRI